MNTPQLQLLILIFAGWVNRSQQDDIEYLQAENRVLREQFGEGRLRFTDSQRRRLALRAKAIGRKGLFGIDTLVTPETLLRWYRRLVVGSRTPARGLLPVREHVLRETIEKSLTHRGADALWRNAFTDELEVDRRPFHRTPLVVRRTRLG